MLFIPYAGDYLDIGEEDFSLFDTQVVKPDHQVITIDSSQEDVVAKKTSVSRKTPASKKLPASGLESDDDAFEKIAMPNDSTDTDDFMGPIRTTRSGRLFGGLKMTDSPGIEAPAIKKKKAPGVDSANILSNKRAPKKAKKLRIPIERLVPAEFTNIENARLLKNFLLSKHAAAKYAK